jgi:hypothetical protein
MPTRTKKQPNLWQRLPWQAQAGVIVVGSGIVFFVGRKHYKKWKKKRELKKMQELYASSNVPVYTAVTAANGVTGFQQGSVNLASVSDTIYDAFYNNDWFGGTEDEEKAADALAKVPPQYISQLEAIYAEAYGKNLRNDFVKFVSDDSENWAKVKHYFGL